MSDGQLGDVFDAFFGGNGYQEILISPGVRAIVTQNKVTLKKDNIPIELTAAQFKALAEILLPNITQTTTINVEEVKKKLTPISKD